MPQFQRYTVLTLFLPFLASFLLPLQAYAAGKQTLIYDVYAGGIHVLDATVQIENDQSSYALSLVSRTQGFLGALVPWQGMFTTQGWTTPAGYRPKLHKSVSVWRGEAETKEYRYDRDKGYESLTITEKGKTRQDKSKSELTQGTTDALTATLNALQAVAEGKKCEGGEDVFDGRRRFKEVFSNQGMEMLQSSRYNIYSGPAEICTVEVIPEAGAWSKKPRGWLSIQEQGRQHGALPTMWVAQLANNAPAVPVKIRIVTSYGTLFLHLAEYRNGDKIVIADKRK